MICDAPTHEFAKRFLSFIDPKADEFVFQTFGKSGKIISGTLDASWDELQAWNAKGNGVAVTVNETTEGRRTAESVSRIRAIWYDDDNGASVEFPLRPSITVETSPGRFHYYWLVEGDWPADEVGRNDFEAVMKRMVALEADRNATDISRAMRLPGTIHAKGKPHTNGGNPHIVTILEPEHDREPTRYTRLEILSAFAGEKNARSVASASPARLGVDTAEFDLDRVRSAVEFIPAEGRYEWLNVGLAIHYGTGGSEDGFRIWDDWSQGTKAGNYDRTEQRRAWSSFRDDHGNPVTLGTAFRWATENGWRDRSVSKKFGQSLPEAQIKIERRPGDLASRAIDAVRTFLADGDKSRPSEKQFAGMEEIAQVIQAMADGTPVLGRDFHLSFLSPGIGKTVTVTQTVKALVASPEYEHVGVVIFLSKVDEIAKLIVGMGLAEPEYATLVSKNYRDQVPLGNPRPDKARVLFTTQQMLEAHLKGKERFEDIDDFHFGGKPRQVRIWDEAILPSKIHTVGVYEISRLYGGLAKIGDGAFKLASDLFSELKERADRDTISMPDMEQFGIGMDEAVGLFKHDEDREAVEALWKLSGRMANVRKDQFGNAALGYRDIFPDDLGPLLILDASGPLRQVYKFWIKDRKGIVPLFSPRKTYAGLTIHHWDRGSGRDQYSSKSKSRRVIYDGIVRAIEAIPEDEKVLIVHFKHGSDTADIETELGALFPQGDRLRFCTWGRHTATNEFADCRHVILASVLQYRTSQNEAYGRSAKKLDPNDVLTEADFDGTRLGEIAHNIFQAACRGTVRTAEGDSCPSGCHLYVIFPSARIPRQLMSHIFPEASVMDWRPVIKLSGMKLKLANRLAELAEPEGVSVQKLGLRRHLDCTKQYLTTLLDDDLSSYMVQTFNVELMKQHHSIHLKGNKPSPSLCSMVYSSDVPFHA